MRRVGISMVALACAVLASLAPRSVRAHPQASALVGTWVGQAAVPGQNLTLRLDIAPADTGIAVVMDIPESKLIRFPVPGARYEDDRLDIDVPPGWGLAMFRDIGLAPNEQVIHYRGNLRDNRLIGTLTVAYANFPMILTRSEDSPVPYRTEDVTFHNGEVTLAGTLYTPRGPGPFPVLEFTHGSGDRTRDSYAHEADLLARAGIAALVYDKRGAGRSTGANWAVATFEDLAGDATAGVEFLAHHSSIDSTRIGLFGLSQGTWLIGMVAEISTHVGFLVFVSGSGIPVWEQELYRTEAMMRAEGFADSEIAEAGRYQRAKFQVARTGLGWAQLDSTSKALRNRARWFSDYANDYASLSSARFWWIAAFHYDPTVTLEHVRVPVLGLFGERDLRFPVTTVMRRMQTDFDRAGNSDVTFHVFPLAEHQLMVPQSFGGRALRRVVTPEEMPILIEWIHTHVGASRRDR